MNVRRQSRWFRRLSRRVRPLQLEGLEARRLLATFTVIDPGDSTSPLFGPAETILTDPAANSPRTIASGDFNGDGQIDIAFSGSSNSAAVVSVMLNQGRGVFGPPTIVATGEGASSNLPLAAGDLDNDGFTDLVLGASGDSINSLIVLAGGPGGLAFQTSLPAVSAATSIVLADLDGDGRLDIIEANPQEVRSIRNLGGGSYATLQTIPNTSTLYSGLAAGDLNGDGRPDVVANSDLIDDIAILLNDGTGQLVPGGAVTVPFSPGGKPPVLADFNNDGNLDLAAVGYEDLGQASLNVFPGNGDGTFGAASYNSVLGYAPSSLVAADFSGDGLVDMATTNSSADQLDVFVGLGAGTFAPSVSFTTGLGPVGLTAADFNGDGVADAATANFGFDFSTPVAGVSFFRNPGTLRWAIDRANARPGPDTIAFNLPEITPGVTAPIALAEQLPDVTGPTLIDGYTQIGSKTNALATGTDAVLKVVIRPQGSIQLDSGLTLAGGGSTIRGLVIGGFQFGIFLATAGHVVSGNYVGVNASGDVAAANLRSGIRVVASGNTIGGTTPADRNVVSGNALNGIEIAPNSTGNTVLGNYIGINASGTLALGNQQYGLVVDDAANTTIGGPTAGARNIISGSLSSGGLIVQGRSIGTRILGNYIGTDSTGTRAIGNFDDGITIVSPGVTVGGTAAGEGNLISGNGTSGLAIFGTGVTSALVLGNLIGTDVTGTLALPNGSASQSRPGGIEVSRGATGVTIGGTASGAGNVISGNGGPGIFVIDAGTANTIIVGNRIGTTSSGNAAIANDGAGILIGDETLSTTIGGTAPGAGNVISGNGAGIVSEGSLTGGDILGNFIGVGADGLTPIGNNGIGISLINTPGVTIAGNVVAHNRDEGIFLTGPGTIQVRVVGNRIGVAADGFTAAGNGRSGIAIANTGGGLTIGGAGDAGNTIVGNSGSGITATNVTNLAIQGNRIAANAADGLTIANGAAVSVSTNTITGNGDFGVRVVGGQAVTILSNAIFANAARPISAEGTGFPSPPDIALAAPGGNVVQFQLDGAPFTSYLIQIYLSDHTASFGAGEGQRFLTELVATTDASGIARVTANLPSSLVAGQFVSATATALVSGGNTGEFSLAYAVQAPIAITIDDVSATLDEDGTGTLVFTVSIDAAGRVPISVDYATADGTAISPLDYVAQAGTLTFPRAIGDVPDTTRLQIRVPIFGRAIDPLVKQFFANLANPFGAVLADTQGTGTIVVVPGAITILGTDGDDTIIVGPVVAAADGLTPIAIRVTINGVERTPINLTTASGRKATIDALAGNDLFVIRLGNLTAPGFIAGGIGLLDLLGNIGNDTFQFESLPNLPNLPNLLLSLDGNAGTNRLTVGSAALGGDVFVYNVPNDANNSATPLTQRLEFSPRSGAIGAFAFRDVAVVDPIAVDGTVTLVGDFGRGRAFGAGANLALPTASRIGQTPGQPADDTMRANVVGTRAVDANLQANNPQVPLLPFRAATGDLRVTLQGESANDLFRVQLPRTFDDPSVQVFVFGGGEDSTTAGAGDLLFLELTNPNATNIQVKSTLGSRPGQILGFDGVESIVVVGKASGPDAQLDQLTFGASLATTVVNLGATGVIDRTTYDPLYVELNADGSRHLAIASPREADQADLRLEGNAQTAEVRLTRRPVGPIRVLNVEGSGNSVLRLVDTSGGARIVSSLVLGRRAGVLVVRYPGRRGATYTIQYQGLARIASNLKLAPGVRLPRNLVQAARSR